ncbi:type III secretion system stalk subunit SctO [Achromobacter aloeverae]|uniref:Uncharacterized protein n=1 Tax=Achromobacter aloeverae TaxID=1750518 RepID=A0A4Q1HHV4_9BURK|nr:YscO family type III secretion system apparatus protein [Achromobacter aloeverae]RXN87784.1 hypothetical protein C7R54_14390 [Achromobacter aloeverae]
MILLTRVLALRASREARDAQSLRRARDARAQADDAVAQAERMLEQGEQNARREGDALFDSLRGGLWTLSAVRDMHGRLDVLRQRTEALRDGVAGAEDGRRQRQAELESARGVHARSRRQLDKTREMNRLREQDVRLRGEREEELEMEEIGASRRTAT